MYVVVTSSLPKITGLTCGSIYFLAETVNRYIRKNTITVFNVVVVIGTIIIIIITKSHTIDKGETIAYTATSDMYQALLGQHKHASSIA